ncbi:hypothetical protein QFZ20_002167 [Flavobacterium sp. W4I14]|nr:hypothetical protein [Flavobacterium sp. W4I14]
MQRQLGAVKGDPFEILIVGGTTIANDMMHKIWLLRNNDGDNW